MTDRIRGRWAKGGKQDWHTFPTWTVRVRLVNGTRRAFIKLPSGDWRWRSVWRWEQWNGCSLPRGMNVHHKDENTLNDAIDNLEVLTLAEHMQRHRDTLNVAKQGAYVRRSYDCVCRYCGRDFVAGQPKGVVCNDQPCRTKQNTEKSMRWQRKQAAAQR